MGGRSMPTECHHGRVIDYGDFGHDDRCEVEDCPECFPPCPDCDKEAEDRRLTYERNVARIKELEAIVSDLAKQDDPSYDPKLGDIKCRYCHEWGRHNAECAWRRARVASGTDTERKRSRLRAESQDDEAEWDGKNAW